MTKPRIGRSRLMGVLVPDVAFSAFAPILAGVTECLEAHGYSMLVAYVRGDVNEQLELAAGLVAWRIDGLILATASRDDPLVAFCLAEQIPTVLVDRTEESAQVSAVVSDDVAGMQMAVDHLVVLGHQSIGHLAGPQQHSTGFLRRQGFAQAMARHGFDPNQAPSVIARNCTRGQGSEAARRLLASHPEITAIVAANDLLALGIYDVLRERGLNCPQDISVVGHDDMPLVDLIHPALTTIRISHKEIGRQAADLLHQAIEESKVVERTIVLRPKLVIRGSTAELQKRRTVVLGPSKTG